MSKSLCIYHGNCADGFGAAWVVHNATNGSAELYPGVYGAPPPDVTGRRVFIVDFSYPRDVIIDMAAKAESITIIDHHKTAQEQLIDLPKNVTVVFDMEKSGAILAWIYFFPLIPPPMLLLHIQDRDLWRFELDGTREIQAALFSYPYEIETWTNLIRQEPELLRQDGEAIERKHHKDIKELLSATMREMVIGGHVVWCANLPYTMASDACHQMCLMPIIDGSGAWSPPAFSACYYDAKDRRVFSLRSVEDFDVSAIAKLYGGGGHKNAAGFSRPIGWEGDQ